MGTSDKSRLYNGHRLNKVPCTKTLLRTERERGGGGGEVTLYLNLLEIKIYLAEVSRCVCV